MPEVPDSAVGFTFIDTDDLMVRRYADVSVLQVRAKSSVECWKALAAWVTEYEKYVAAAHCSYNDYKRCFELNAVYSRR